MLVLGLAGLVVNGTAAAALARANRQRLNVEGAFKHNLIDAYASLGTAAAAAIILITGFNRADPIASLIIAIPMLRMGGKLVWAPARIFLEAAAEGIDPDQIGRAMAGVAHVREIHDLHVWEVTGGFPAFSAHVLVGSGEDCHEARRQLEHPLHDTFHIGHTTLQVDHQGHELRELLSIEGSEQRASTTRYDQRHRPTRPAS